MMDENTMTTETELADLAVAAGMVSLLDQGAASCVHSEGCNGVTQEHLQRFAELVRREALPRISHGSEHPIGGRISQSNLDDMRRLRDEAMAAGLGSGRWIKAAQALMDAFPDYYATAKAMNVERETLRSAMTVVVSDWTEQFERNGHLAPSWVKQARAALGA